MFEAPVLDFLKRLMETRTPSGFEEAGQREIARYLAQSQIATRWDVHGNLHAELNVGAKRTCMLEAHCDEIGFLINYITDRGMLSVIANGGVTPQTVLGERVKIMGKQGWINGVFGVRPPHLMTAKDREHLAPTDLDSIFIDIGASTRLEAEELVEIGTCAVIDAQWRPLAGNRISCRGFDNRIGAFITAEVMRRLAIAKPSVNILFVGSVQEELGLIGCTNAASDLKPDMGICIDVGFATDVTESDRNKAGDVRLGGGPILGVGPFYNHALRKHISTSAQSLDIPIQLSVQARAAGNNAYALRMAGGAATAIIAIPLRYMHSPVEVVDLNDVEAIVNLLTHTLTTLPEDISLCHTLPPDSDAATYPCV